MCVCIEVVERHTRSFSSGGNQWEHIFLYPMDRVLKEEDLARVPFLDDDPPGALLQIGRRYLGKIYRGHPLPPPSRVGTILAFSREPPSKSRDLFKFEETRYGNPFPPVPLRSVAPRRRRLPLLNVQSDGAGV